MLGDTWGNLGGVVAAGGGSGGGGGGPRGGLEAPRAQSQLEMAGRLAPDHAPGDWSDLGPRPATADDVNMVAEFLSNVLGLQVTAGLPAIFHRRKAPLPCFTATSPPYPKHSGAWEDNDLVFQEENVSVSLVEWWRW